MAIDININNQNKHWLLVILQAKYWWKNQLPKEMKQPKNAYNKYTTKSPKV